MAVNADAMKRDGAKGKAVLVLHTWNDTLFDQGRKGDPPEPTVEMEPKEEEVVEPSSETNETPAESVPEQAEATLTPQGRYRTLSKLS
jgi:translation initiation factor 2D